MKGKALVLLLAAVLSSGGCSQIHIAQHPGSIDDADNTAYNALLLYDDAIKSTKADLASGVLPATAKPVVNKFIDAYNVLQAATTAYHNQGVANPNAQDLLGKLSDAEAAAAAAFAELVKINPKVGVKKT
jgi:hypothetical protein